MRLTAADEPLAFRAPRATGRAGYYRAKATDPRRGDLAWIILADGEQRGARAKPEGSSGPGPEPPAERAGTNEPAPGFDRFDPNDRFDPGAGTDREPTGGFRPPNKVDSSDVEEGLG